MNPRYPIFIPSKGRHETPFTARAMDSMGVPYHVVVEPQEAEQYAAAVGGNKVIVLPHRDKGLVVTRNWIWDYAEQRGYPKFWTMDDNIRMFYRLNRNTKIPIQTGDVFRAAEDFVGRYDNVPVAGFQYEMFAPRRVKLRPFELNTRVYSNMLIETFSKDNAGKPYRNHGFYNDDTDLCLRMLKDGRCTILFLAFLAWKFHTMLVKGGMTPHYQGDGRLKMAQELQRAHPDVTKITWKWGRWQHQVDYRPFKNNKLRLKPGVVIPDSPNEYGMNLVAV